MTLSRIAGIVAAAAVLARSAGAPAPRKLLGPAEADDKANVTPDGRFMAMTDWSSGDIALRDLSTGQLKRLLAKPGGWESDDFGEFAVPSPDLRQIAYVWHEGSNPGHLRIMPNQPGAKARVLVKNSEFPYVLPSAWSPDGKSVLVHMWKLDYTAQIAWVSVADGSVKLLRSLEWRRPAHPSLSPDGRYIAYSALDRDDSPDSHIYVLAADGSRETEIVTDAGVNEAPVWTLDGAHILFTSNRSGSFGLWSIPVQDGRAAGAALLVQPDTGKIAPIGLTRSGSLYYVREHGEENVLLAGLEPGGAKVRSPAVALPEFAGSNRGPAWSPNGKFLAFKRRASGNRAGYDLVIRSLETSREKIYTSSTLVGHPARPLWFKDSKAVLLAMSDRQERISFQRLDLESGGFTEVLATDSAYLGISDLSPDDKTLYVSVHDDKKNIGSIAAFDIAGGAYRQVFAGVGFVNNFALSPDGRTLAIAHSVPHEGHWQGRLSRVAVDGTDVRELYVPAPEAEQDIFGGGPMLTWSHDGRAILFGAGTRSWRLMRIPAEGGQPEFTGLETAGLRHDLVLSPDGARIAFGFGKSSIKETWVLESLNGESLNGSAASAPAHRSEHWVPAAPLGLDTYMAIPETNPMSEPKVALGRELFFDKRLSRDGTVACATCHDPERAFSDGRRVAVGVGGAQGLRNSPAIVNRGYGQSFFWDGRADSLERQVLEPILNPKELDLTESELERRTKLKTAEITAALASYVRTIRSGNSPYDRYMAGDAAALSAVEKAGLELFRGKGHCVSCHAGPNFTDEQLHNTGVAWRDGKLADTGAGRGRFKTPTLREVARTAPYMHDGGIATLEDVVEFYSQGGRANPDLDPEIRPRRFTAEEKRALVAFLRALSGTYR